MKMNVLLTIGLFVCLACQLFVGVRSSEDTGGMDDDDDDDAGLPFVTWDCNDMIPDLCSLDVTTGTFVSTCQGKLLEIAYWIYQPSSSMGSDKLPLVVVNGGPGMSHDYVTPLKQLACRGRQVIFYDQGGTGKSSIPDNKTIVDDYPCLLDVSYYASELGQLIESLDLDQFHLYGDSYGTQLALQFALHGPEAAKSRMLSLMLQNPIPSSAGYIKAQWDPHEGTVGRLPPYLQTRIRALIKADAFDSAEYEQIDTFLTTDFFYRSGIIPDCALPSLVGKNIEIYAGMQGPSEYSEFTGTLRDFDVMSQLSTLSHLPVLIGSGEYDFVRPSTVAAMHAQLPLSEVHYYLGSGHSTLYDAMELVLADSHDFMDRVETSMATNSPFQPMSSASDVDAENDAKCWTAWSSSWQHSSMVVFTLVVGGVIGFWSGRRSAMFGNGSYQQITP